MGGASLGQEFIQKLKKDIINNELLKDKDIRILRFQFYKKSHTLKVVIKSMDSLHLTEEDELKNIIIKNLGIQVEVDILCYKDVTNVSLDCIVSEHWSSVVEETARKYPLCRTLLYSPKRKVENKTIYIYSGNDTLIKHTMNKKIHTIIESNIKDIFDITARLEF